MGGGGSTAISGGVARRVVRKIRRVTGESWAVGDSDQEPAAAFLPLPLSFHPQAGLQRSTVPILPFPLFFVLQPYSPSLGAAAEECPSSVGRSIPNSRPALQLRHQPRALPSLRSNSSLRPVSSNSRRKSNYLRRPVTTGVSPSFPLPPPSHASPRVPSPLWIAL